MSEPVPHLPPMTFDEFLTWEDSVEDRHEFIDGVVYAMSGASTPHHLITGNIGALLWIAAYQGKCRVYQQAAKLRSVDNLFYPDVMVVCAPDGEDYRMAYAPCLLVEVLSAGSKRHDRVRKLAKYQMLPSVRAYLIVSQEYRHVERHWRDSADTPWQREEITVAEGRVPVPCPTPGELTFDEIYRLTTVPDRPPLRRVRETYQGGDAPGGETPGGDPKHDEPYTTEPA